MRLKNAWNKEENVYGLKPSKNEIDLVKYIKKIKKSKREKLKKAEN